MIARLRFIYVCAIVTLLAVPNAQAQIDIQKFVNHGKYIYVFNSPETGDSVIAVGLSSSGASENEKFEIARTDAYKKLAAFLNGENMSSISEYQLSSSQGEVTKSFFSKRTSSVSALIRAAQEIKVGTTARGRYYVALQLSENGINVSGKLKQKLEDNTLSSIGYSSLEGGIERARRIALDSALRNAVAMYNGVGAAGQSTVTNATDLRSSMATRANGVVTNYRIVFEGKVDGSYKVEIVAKVEEKISDPEQISEAVRENLGRPSIYIKATDQYVVSALGELLVTNKFSITRDRSSARFILDVAMEVEEKPTLADMLGRRTSLVITLNDVLSSDPAVVISNNPDDSLEVSDSQRIRASRSAQYAVESLKDDLLQNLSGAFVEQFNNGSKVRVSFENFGKLRFVDSFINLLEGLPLTKKASLRPINDGTAYIDLIYLGDPTELQILVVKNASKYKLFGLKAKNKNDAGFDFTF